MEKEGRHREKWSSWVAFVWAATGAAVGLGNVWKFPYMAGSSGGSAFVLMYLVFVLLVAVPVMIAEIMLGKLSQRNAVDGFLYLAHLHGYNPLWRITGYLGSLTLLLVFCFYSVVAGWSIAYLYFGMSDSFAGQTPAEIQQMWEQFLAEPRALVLCSFLFIFFTMAIVYFGVKNGIERACAFIMPGLFVVLVMLVFYSASRGGFAEACDFLFSFQPNKIETSVVIASLGHAFFTLAVGACAMMVYGSHLPKKVSVVKSVLLVALLDVVVAILSGLAIFPLIFNNNLAPGQGPGLMFVSLPIVFAEVPFGWLWATLFFVLLFSAALSSSLSFAEPIVDLIVAKLRLRRGTAVVLVGLSVFFGSIFCALSFSIWDTKLFARWTIFDVVADISTNILLPVGAIAISIFAGLVIKETDFLIAKRKYDHIFYWVWRIIVLAIAPIAISIVMINSLVGFLS